MKKLLGLLAVLLLLGAAAWWFIWKPSAETVPPAKVILPAAKSAVAGAPSLPEAKTPEDVANAARAEVKKTVAELIGLLEAGQGAEYLQRIKSPSLTEKSYLAYTDSLKKFNQDLAGKSQPPVPIVSLAEYEQLVRNLPLTPVMEARLKAELAALKSIEQATPRLNASGDEAVYLLTPAVSATLSNNPELLNFHKENGRWYEGPMPK